MAVKTATAPAAAPAVKPAPAPATAPAAAAKTQTKQAATAAHKGTDGFDSDPTGLRARTTSEAGAASGARHPEKAVAELNNASKEYEGAKKEKDKMDRRLGEELAHVGPGLTNDEREKFISSFQNEHKDVYGRERNAANHLARVLERNRGTLEHQAVTCSTKEGATGKDAAQAVARALDDLAGSSQAGRAVKVAGELLEDGKGIKALMRAGGKELHDAFDKVAEQALPQAAGEIYAHHEDPKAALKEIEGLVQPFTSAKSAYKDGKKAKEALGAMRDAARGDTKALARLAEEWKHGAKPSALSKGLAAIGVVFGATEAAKNPSFETAVKAFGKTKAGVDVLARSIGGLEKGGEIAASLGKVAKIAGRFAPGAGVVLNLANAAIDWKEARKGGHPGSYAMAVGDLISAAGSAVEAFGPPGAVVGGLINAVGTAFSLIGMGINKLFGSNPESAKHEAQRLLEDKLHLNHDTAKGLAYSDSRAMGVLDRAGLTPKQIKGLAREYENLLDNEAEAKRYLAIARGMKIPISKLDEMLDTVAGFMEKANGNKNNGSAVNEFYNLTFHAFGDMVHQPSPQKVHEVLHQLPELYRALKALA